MAWCKYIVHIMPCLQMFVLCVTGIWKLPIIPFCIVRLQSSGTGEFFGFPVSNEHFSVPSFGALVEERGLDAVELYSFCMYAVVLHLMAKGLIVIVLVSPSEIFFGMRYFSWLYCEFIYADGFLKGTSLSHMHRMESLMCLIFLFTVNLLSLGGFLILFFCILILSK